MVIGGRKDGNGDGGRCQDGCGGTEAEEERLVGVFDFLVRILMVIWNSKGKKSKSPLVEVHLLRRRFLHRNLHYHCYHRR